METGDYIEEHSYSDPLVPGTADDLFAAASRQTRVPDMPYFMGELNQKESLVNVPSRTTLLFSSAVYGSFYNWTGINFFAWNHGDQYIDENGYAKEPFRTPDLSNDESKGFLIGELEKDSMMLDHLRTAGLLYRNGYVRTSTQKQLYMVDEPYWANSYAAIITPKYSFRNGWQSVHSIYKQFTPENQSIPLTQTVRPIFSQNTENPAVSDTNEIIKDADKKRLIVQAPQAEGFSGFTDGGETIACGHLEADGQEGSATVLFVSADGKAICESSHMIVSKTSVAHSHGAQLNGITGTEYEMALHVKNLKEPANGGYWQFKVTRPAEAAGEYVLTADAQGKMELPAGWNEGELHLIRGAGEYVLTAADGRVLSALPPEGGSVSVDLPYADGLGGSAQMIGALYETRNFRQLEYWMDEPRTEKHCLENIPVPEQAQEILAQTKEAEYLDKTAEEGVEYEYMIQACAGDEAIGTPWLIRTELSASKAQPLPIKNLTVGEVHSNSAALEWEHSPEAAGYNIYRDGRLLMENVLENGYTDTSVQPQNTYIYEIRALRDGVESMGASARITTPEDTDLIFQFYRDGAYGNLITYDRLDDNGQFLVTTITAALAAPEMPEGSRVLRYKLTNNGADAPDRMQYINLAWGSARQPIAYSLTDVLNTAAVKLSVCLTGARQNAEIGFVNKNEDGSVYSLRLPLSDYIETEDLNYVTAGRLVWQEAVIPLSDFAQKGRCYRSDALMPEAENAFDWGNTAGFTLALSNEKGVTNSICYLNDIHLAYLQDDTAVPSLGRTPVQMREKGVLLRWELVENADSYRIFRRGGKYGIKVFLWDVKRLKPLFEAITIR